MAKPATATWGTDGGRVHVAYVKSRRVLRLTGPDQMASPLEVPIAEFCHNLGIDAGQIGPPRHYLLFARLHTNPGSSPRFIVEPFTTEDEARETFRALRRLRSHPDDWAETVSLDASGRLRTLCWFGIPWGPRGRNRTVPASRADKTGVGTHRQSWIRRWYRRKSMNHHDLPTSKSPGISPNRRGSRAETPSPEARTRPPTDRVAAKAVSR